MTGYMTRIVTSISKERLPALLGRDGEVIREIERSTGTKISVKRKTGEVLIDIDERAESPDPLRARDMVRAIDLGFDPETALRLKSPDVYLDVIDLKEYVSGREHLIRVKGRIIGAGGKTKRLISEFTGVDMIVGSTYVAMIGTFEELQGARRAVEMLIQGAQHSSVYRFLERFRAEMKRREILGGVWP